MRNTRQLAAALTILVSILACTMPSGDAVIAAATAFAQTQTAAAVPGSPLPSATAAGAPGETPAVPSATVSVPPTACSPIVTANTSANVRAGDSTDYEIIGFLAAGATAPLVGRNAADTWWYIAYGGGHGWIAKSVATGSCLPVTVAVVAPPPLPPTKTPTTVAVEFAVTSVSYTFSLSDYGPYHACPMMTAHITASAPGTVTYRWTRSDGASAPVESVNFASAGTKNVVTNWALGAVWAGTTHWLGIYVDAPNHQDFGHESFTEACAP